MIQFNASQIAALIGGKLEGNAAAVVSTIAKIEEGGEHALCFIANPKYEHYAQTVSCSVLLVRDSLAVNNPKVKAIIKCSDPYTAFTKILSAYQQLMQSGSGISGMESQSVFGEGSRHGSGFYLGAFAYVGRNVTIGNNVRIYPFTFIGDHCTIGDDTVIYSGVHVYHQSLIGKRTIIHSGAVIGADGFGFAPQPDGSYSKIPQTGNVVIGDDVEIGANTTIDRATIGSTIIRNGVKLDNLIQVAHNVEIGENTVSAAQAGISGSAKLGKNIMIGGQAGITGHLTIADGSKIQAKAAVIKDINEPNKGWSGVPAWDAREHYRVIAAMKQLPDLLKRVDELEKLLKKNAE